MSITSITVPGHTMGATPVSVWIQPEPLIPSVAHAPRSILEPAARVVASNGQVELDEAVVGEQPGDGCRQARGETKAQARDCRVSPDSRQRVQIPASRVLLLRRDSDVVRPLLNGPTSSDEIHKDRRPFKE